MNIDEIFRSKEFALNIAKTLAEYEIKGCHEIAEKMDCDFKWFAEELIKAMQEKLKEETGP